MRISGIHKMSSKKQIVGLLAAAIIGDVFIRNILPDISPWRS